MTIIKCKMCGGELEIEAGETVGTCEYCGSKQTLPRLDDDRKANLYDRANHFRRNNEFDKASSVYERLLSEDPEDAEAYWSLVLCRYGIEYVEDPATHKRVPTVNRAQYTSIFDDDNYKQAIAHADIQQKIVYEEEAKAINEIQKGILAISQKEDPFDVFICYKETDNNGRRTMDSVLANDLYHQLTNEGFKVFFSRITLEDKLGVAYEPYIFAALNSAKVMVVLGTKPEYFNAVWVKNEWSRYLSIVRQSGGKKVLIPAYRDMDPYDLPEEFSHLQAQDMSKLGFMQDLIRGIKKIVSAELPKEAVKGIVTSGTGVAPLLKRGEMALEDRDWKKADSFFEDVLNLEPEEGKAFLGKFLAERHCANLDDFVEFEIQKNRQASTEALDACEEDCDHIEETITEYEIEGYLSRDVIRQVYTYSRSYNSALLCRKVQKQRQLDELNMDKLLIRAKQFAKGKTKEDLDASMEAIRSALDERIEQAQRSDTVTIERITQLYKEYISEADHKVQRMYEHAVSSKDSDYRGAINSLEQAKTPEAISKVRAVFLRMEDYEQSQEYITKCDNLLERMNQTAKRKKTVIALAISSLVLALLITWGVNASKKSNAVLEQVKQNLIGCSFQNTEKIDKDYNNYRIGYKKETVKSYSFKNDETVEYNESWSIWYNSSYKRASPNSKDTTLTDKAEFRYTASIDLSGKNVTITIGENRYSLEFDSSYNPVALKGYIKGNKEVYKRITK